MSPFLPETFCNLAIIVYACQCHICLNHTELFLVFSLTRLLGILEILKSCSGLFFPWFLSSCHGLLNILSVNWSNVLKPVFYSITPLTRRLASDFSDWQSYFIMKATAWQCLLAFSDLVLFLFFLVLFSLPLGFLDSGIKVEIGKVSGFNVQSQ